MRDALAQLVPVEPLLRSLREPSVVNGVTQSDLHRDVIKQSTNVHQLQSAPCSLTNSCMGKPPQKALEAYTRSQCATPPCQMSCGKYTCHQNVC